MAKARNGGIELEYETFGPPEGRPLLLISGMVAQLTMYPVAFCRALADAGFQVIRFDNRDAGLSTHLDGVRPPSLLGAMLRPAAAPYTLRDMADDAVAVMDAAGWSSAHVLGTSMGGFVAQLVAIGHPGRVRSLISISSTPDPRLGGLPGPSVFRPMSRIVKTAETSRAQAEDLAVEMFRLVGSPGYPFDEPGVRETARLSYDRSPATREGNLRQRAASASSRDRRPALSRLRVPVLVLHGDRDPMMNPRGARAMAAAIPGARLVMYPGMGHDLPQPLWPAMIEEIVRTTGEGERPAPDGAGLPPRAPAAEDGSRRD
jgi:pimeloyl-ACP methyl ester carboxylesterase